jgi:hypothetical protein
MANPLEVADLMAENARLRSALTQFLAACDTAIPTSLMLEIGIAAKAARAALNIKCEYCEKPHDPRVACPEYAARTRA